MTLVWVADLAGKIAWARWDGLIATPLGRNRIGVYAQGQRSSARRGVTHRKREGRVRRIQLPDVDVFLPEVVERVGVIDPVEFGRNALVFSWRCDPLHLRHSRTER